MQETHDSRKGRPRERLSSARLLSFRLSEASWAGLFSALRALADRHPLQLRQLVEPVAREHLKKVHWGASSPVRPYRNGEKTNENSVTCAVSQGCPTAAERNEIKSGNPTNPCSVL